MDYDNAMMVAMVNAFRRPKPPSRAMQASVMSRPNEPVPEIGADLPLESVSPEDWIPNPKTVLSAALAKGGAGLAGMTGLEAVREGRKFAKTLTGRERDAVEHYTNVGSPLHAFRINNTLREGASLKPEELEYINTLTNVLRKAPKSDTSFEMYRGMPGRFANIEKPDPGFMSITSDIDSAKIYSDAGKDLKTGAPGVIRKFNAPVGTPLVDPDVKRLWLDLELLMPRNTTIKGNNLILPEDFR